MRPLRLFRWIDSIRGRARDLDVLRQLRDLESRARGASVAFRPHYLVRAAQLAAAANRKDQALTLYGRAIDGYLEAGRARAAEALCRKVLAEYPQVVRARRTLALLALGRGDYEEADRLIQEYAEAARKHGDAAALMGSLRMMARIAGAGPVLRRAASDLRAAGDSESAEIVMHAAAEAPEDPAGVEPSGEWSDALRAALLAPSELSSVRPHG